LTHGTLNIVLRHIKLCSIFLLKGSCIFVLSGFVVGMIFTTPAQSKYASLVVDAETGIELYARNADTKNFPASLTKIMTLYMIFDALERRKWNLKTRLKVSRRASRQPQTRLGVKRGRTISVRTAILALITRSANDVATVVAENMSGSERAFARKMTVKARSIGMRATTFRNASGLPNRGQLSTARDMAKLAISIRRDFPQFYHFFKTKKFRYRGRTFRNHNMLLGRYSGTDGIKTGYTNASGYNLVASVRRKGQHLIGVVFGGRTGPRRDRHMVNLLDKSFWKLDRLAKLSPPKPRINPLGKSIYLSRSDFSERSRSIGANWGIQVGAYSSDKPARLMIQLVRKHLKIDSKLIYNRVEKVERTHGVIFRARLLGMGERQARKACASLVVKHLPCVPVPMNIELARAPTAR
tara:strand:+ start:1913 stop:3145 length:1233 start_codon:yes stop_codon:yes gene_type:complete